VIIGVPKEIKTREYRVGMTPAGVRSLTQRGHKVLVETNAGIGSGLKDEEYVAQGAQIVATAKEAWSADMVVKVKEPIEAEYRYLTPDLMLYTYLHLAARPPSSRDALVENKVSAIAYETVRDRRRQAPAAPADERSRGAHGGRRLARSASKKSTAGAACSSAACPAWRPANVAILGGGVVGSNAVKIAVGMGAHVTVLDIRARPPGLSR
jgi:alanine dehydrogenase